jgi:hypothetical protein
VVSPKGRVFRRPWNWQTLNRACHFLTFRQNTAFRLNEVQALHRLSGIDSAQSLC